MQIKSPLTITSRLKPGVEIGGATISIEYACVGPDDRQAYRWFIDLPLPRARNGEFQGEDLCSGVGGGTLQKGLENLLVFLGAFAEDNADTSEDWEPSENANLFPLELAKWAVENADEISTLAIDLEENPDEYIIE